MPIESASRAASSGSGSSAEVMTGVRAALSAGASPEQIEDALAVCFAFNTSDRIANAFSFEMLSPAGFEAGAKYLLKKGYQ